MEEKLMWTYIDDDDDDDGVGKKESFLDVNKEVMVLYTCLEGDTKAVRSHAYHLLSVYSSFYPTQ